MRILVLSDIHGNYEALKAVDEKFDALLCLGDLADYGPAPEDCAEWVRERAHSVVRGNHDNAVAKNADCNCSDKTLHLSKATREYTRSVLSKSSMEFLGSLPLALDVELGGSRIHMVHAAPSDPLFKYLQADKIEEWQSEIEDIDADIILAGHTHIPFFMHVKDKLILNPGSVGQPRDGDPRLSYALIEGNSVILKRKEYEIQKTIDALCRTSLAGEVTDQLAKILKTGKV